MLISILGDVGSGKTLLATYLAYIDIRTVYSNYEIALGDRRKELLPETLLKLQPGSLVIIDEAYTWLESRRSGRAINQYLSYILFQSRKRDMDIIMTDQLVGTIDLRFRQMTNYEIQCEAIEEGFEYRIFKLSSYQRYRPRRFVMPFDLAEKIYPLYNSWELVNPIDDELIYHVTKDKTEIVKIVAKHASKILETVPMTKLTKGITANYCLENSLPRAYIDLIYNSAKSSQYKSGD